MITVAMRTISEDFHNANQSWNYEKLITVSKGKVKHKLKIVIVRNAYDFQSHAQGYRFDGNQWHQLVSIPFTRSLISHSVSYVDAAPDITKFRTDARAIQDRLESLIF